MKRQPPKTDSVKIIAGVQAWDFAKAPPPARTADEIALNQVIPDTMAENIPPVVLGVEELDNIHRLRIAPQSVKNITIQRANQGEDLPQEKITAICLNIAEKTQATHIILQDEAEQLLENLSEYIHRLRHNAETKQTAEMITKAENIALNLNDEKPKQKEIVNAFLKWNKAPLRRDIISGRTFEYNGILWSYISDEELKRKVADFYDDLDVDYSFTKISKLADLITLRIDKLPQENPYFIGFRNGVLNKKTGEFLPHKADHFIRFIDDFNCTTHSKKTPFFDDWLDFVSHNNEPKKQAILAGLYMILTNRHEWGLFLEATGTAGAGKSIFGEIATIINGKGNTAILDLKAFEDIKGRVVLIGKTLAYSPDQKPYKGTADDLKAMTGGDPIKIKQLYRDEIEIKVNAVFMMSTNYPITFTDRNGGITRRRVIIHFTRAIPKEKKDVNFIEKVRQEVYGITNLLLSYFPNPETARKTLEAYQDLNEGLEIKREANSLIDFARAFTVKPQNVNGLKWGSNYINSKTTKNNALYKAYLHYCECHNLKNPLNLSAFKQAMPDALKEAGEKAEVTQHKTGGYIFTNIHWRDREQTLKEWEE